MEFRISKAKIYSYRKSQYSASHGNQKRSMQDIYIAFVDELKRFAAISVNLKSGKYLHFS